MPRPPTTSPVRPRATARSFPKPKSSPTPLDMDREGLPATTMYRQVGPTPPYSSGEDVAMYSRPYFVPSSSIPTPTTAEHDSPSISPQQVLSSPGGPYGIYPHSYPSASYFPSAYQPSSNMVRVDDYVPIPRQPTVTEPHPLSTPVSAHVELPSEEPEGVSSKPDGKVHTPRPPNAWILYRSDMLRTIAAGGEIPGLDAVMLELGVPLSSESSGEEANQASVSCKVAAGDDNTESKPKRKPKKGKKGAKEPSEGLLSLGRGKTGRGLPQADISKMISMLWKRETPEVRGNYEKRSEMKKQEHQLMYPDYKFQPLRKADKIKQREEKEREREAARRAKDLQRSGGSRRRPRTRNRLSPNSPYSVLTPEGSRMARSLTYSGGGQLGDNGNEGLPSNNAHRSPVDAHDRFRSYPFPMPQSSLPSLHPEELGVSYDATFSAGPVHGTTGAGERPGHAPGEGPAAHSSVSGAPPLAEGFTGVSSHPAGLSSAKPAVGQQQPPQRARLPRRTTEPVHATHPTMRAPPRLPTATVQTANALKHKEQDQAGAHEIAALWSNLEEADAEDYALVPSDVTPFRSYAECLHGEGGRQMEAAPEYQAVRELVDEEGRTLPYAQPTHQTFSEIELRNVQPDSFAGGWVTYGTEAYAGATYDTYGYFPYVESHDATDQAIMYATDSAMAASEEVVWSGALYDLNAGADTPFIVGDLSGGPLVPMEAVIVEDNGPFLSEQAVFSPDGEWTLRPADSNTGGDGPSDEREDISQVYTMMPRHVSSSAFPITPQSGTHSLPPTNGWNDRATSFAFANSLNSSLDIDFSPDDVLNWEDPSSPPGAVPQSRQTSRSAADIATRGAGGRSGPLMTRSGAKVDHKGDDEKAVATIAE